MSPNLWSFLFHFPEIFLSFSHILKISNLCIFLQYTPFSSLSLKNDWVSTFRGLNLCFYFSSYLLPSGPTLSINYFPVTVNFFKLLFFFSKHLFWFYHTVIVRLFFHLTDYFSFDIYFCLLTVIINQHFTLTNFSSLYPLPFTLLSRRASIL